MNLHVKKLIPEAVLPTVAHVGDAGADLYATEEVTLAPGARTAVATGIAMRVPDGHVALVWDKSGRAVNDGLKTMAGVVDSGYRGEVKVVVVNLGAQPVTIKAKEKIAQVLIQPVVSPTITEVSSLDETTRGEGGFGSTGLTAE